MTWFDVVFSYLALFATSELAALSYIKSTKSEDDFGRTWWLGGAVYMLAMVATSAARLIAEII